MERKPPLLENSRIERDDDTRFLFLFLKDSTPNRSMHCTHPLSSK